jgi:hypothetical protein
MSIAGAPRLVLSRDETERLVGGSQWMTLLEAHREKAIDCCE